MQTKSMKMSRNLVNYMISHGSSMKNQIKRISPHTHN